MAKLERRAQGAFHEVLERLTDGILQGSISASLEDSADYSFADGCVAVRVFERYSFAGGNRLSLTLIVAEKDHGVTVTAITSGGSQAMFWKVNTLGEEAFLQTLRELLE